MSTYRNTKPLIAFGDVVDFSTGGKSPNITVTGAQADPFGGTAAYRVQDTAVGSPSEGLSYPGAGDPLTANAEGEATVEIYMKENTDSGAVEMSIRDSDVAVDRHLVQIDLSQTPPVLTTTTGAGTLFPPVAVGGGWYLIRFSATGIVSGNDHRSFVYPAGRTPAGVGDLFVYGRSSILFGLHLDSARAWAQPREGSEWVKSPSGVEDAWIVGDDEMLEGIVRWVPGLDRGDPQNQTGWDGRRENELHNVGWASLLKFADRAQVVRFAPDQSDLTVWHDVYVVSPREAETRRHELEGADMTRQFALVLRDSSDVPFEGY